MGSLLSRPAYVIPLSVALLSPERPILHIYVSTHWPATIWTNDRRIIQLKYNCKGEMQFGRGYHENGYDISLGCDICHTHFSSNRTKLWTDEEFENYMAKCIFDGSLGLKDSIFDSTFVEVEISNKFHLGICCFDTKAKTIQHGGELPVLIALVPNDKLYMKNEFALQAARLLLQKTKNISIQQEKLMKDVLR